MNLKILERLPISHRAKKQMAFLHPADFKNIKKSSYWKEKIGTALLLFALCLGFSILQNIGETKEEVIDIARPMPGDGKKQEILYVGREDTDKLSEVTFSISERRASQSEAERCMMEAYEQLKKEFQTVIERAEQMPEKLNLPEKMENGVKINWFSSDSEWIDLDGNIHIMDLEQERTVILTAWMQYGEFEERREFYIPLKPWTGEKPFENKLVTALKKADEENGDQRSIALPNEIDGIFVWYQTEEAQKSGIFVILGIFAGIGGFFLKNQRLKKECEKKKEVLEMTYPEIVMKLSLLIQGGMTIRGAWEKVVEGYQKVGQRQYAYEEMEVTLYQLKQGTSEKDAYREFGKRCELGCYRKLASLLEQNLAKGSRGLSILLEDEVSQAFDERKNFAVRKGEEATTKLLLPMFLMLAVVMILCVAPALLSFQGI